MRTELRCVPVGPPSWRPLDSSSSEDTLLIAVLALVASVVVITAFVSLAFFSLSLVFLTTVAFENGSGEDLRVTPVGSLEPGSIYLNGSVEIGRTGPVKATFGSANRNIEIASNDTLPFHYDWDDQNLQFLLVIGPSGAIKILAIDEHIWRARGYGECCWHPANDTYVIPPLAGLPDAPAALLPTLEGEYVLYRP